jgi:hypothetical protein
VAYPPPPPSSPFPISPAMRRAMSGPPTAPAATPTPALVGKQLSCGVGVGGAAAPATAPAGGRMRVRRPSLTSGEAAAGAAEAAEQQLRSRMELSTGESASVRLDVTPSGLRPAEGTLQV